MQRNSNFLSALFGLALMVACASGFARDTGTVISYQRSDAAFSDDSSIAYSWAGDRRASGDNSKWEWKWEKFYPEYTTYCSASGGCSSSVSYSKAEAIASMIGVSFAGASNIIALTKTLTMTFQKTFTTTNTYTFTQTANMVSGQNAYAGIISLQRNIMNGEIKGRWDLVKNSCRMVRIYTYCSYKWDQLALAGTWSGYFRSRHRTYLCTTPAVVSPANGQTLPSGCSKPALPAGWYGG